MTRGRGVSRAGVSDAQAEERARALGTIRDEWIGTPGERLTLTVHVETRKVIEGVSVYCATKTLHKFRDAQGRAAVWFATGCATEMSEGRTYRVKATVKKHDTYDGHRQTVLNRVIVLTEVVSGELAEAA